MSLKPQGTERKNEIPLYPEERQPNNKHGACPNTRARIMCRQIHGLGRCSLGQGVPDATDYPCDSRMELVHPGSPGGLGRSLGLNRSEDALELGGLSNLQFPSEMGPSGTETDLERERNGNWN